MYRILVPAYLCALIPFVASCDRRPASQAPSTDYDKFVTVAAIDPALANRVGQILERAGIQCIIEGSVAYGVRVAPERELKAVSLLRADSAAEKYWIQFSSDNVGEQRDAADSR